MLPPHAVAATGYGSVSSTLSPRKRYNNGHLDSDSAPGPEDLGRAPENVTARRAA